VTGVVLRRHGGDGGARLVEIFNARTGVLPGPGDRIKPKWVWVYEESDVHISRPDHGEISHLLDEVGHEWDGSMLVELPDMVIDDIGRSFDKTLRRDLGSIKGVNGAVWVDNVVYLVDAPTLDEATLLPSIVDLLNSYLAKKKKRKK
jgi:hypothetical protein